MGDGAHLPQRVPFLIGHRALMLEQISRFARDARKKHHQIAVHCGERVGGANHGLHKDAAIGIELDKLHPTIGCDVLILLSDGLA